MLHKITSVAAITLMFLAASALAQSKVTGICTGDAHASATKHEVQKEFDNADAAAKWCKSEHSGEGHSCSWY